MSHGPTQIASKGFCIYCGRSGLKLTDEHIVPLSLGGAHVIKDASCVDCARVTSRFELEVARNLWGDARISYGAPSRRKKLRPQNIALNDIAYPGNKITIPYSEYPAAMIFYLMKGAGVLLGLPEDVDQSGSWQFRAVVDDQKIKAFERKYPGRLTAKFKHIPDSFGRLIAKIGYGQILCTLDPQDFHPICVPYILGIKSNLSHIIGGRWSIPEPTPGIGYELNTCCAGDNNNILLIAEIRLTANCHTPVYHAVVGAVTGPDSVAKVLNKLQAPAPTLMADSATYQPIQDDRFHWQPRVWPLPIFAELGSVAE
ncbi:HNH endonuclease [Ralstonia sp. 1B3]|uniref:HNH endonuclease n=1 Tax=Ralstonia sp. 1B3 TaxID=2997421 RepID=UPI002FCAD55E